MKKGAITPKQMVEFMIIAGKLKWRKRSGWLRERMPEPETVAEHTFRVVILSRILAPLFRLSSEKLTSMAIFHDLAEGVLGDPVTQRGKRNVGSHDIEKESRFMKNVFYKLGRPDLFKYWEENILENGLNKTKYSDILYQIGKIATVWQAFEYELRGVPRESTKEFWENADYHVKHPYLRKLLRVFKQTRKTLKLL